MAWNLHEADLPRDAINYLSVLGGCGDGQRAAAEAGVTVAEVRRWERLDEFVSHRAKALAHFEDWKDYKPGAYTDPSRWPGRGRLDTRFDPWRVG